MEGIFLGGRGVGAFRDDLTRTQSWGRGWGRRCGQKPPNCIATQKKFVGREDGEVGVRKEGERRHIQKPSDWTLRGRGWVRIKNHPAKLGNIPTSTLNQAVWTQCKTELH